MKTHDELKAIHDRLLELWEKKLPPEQESAALVEIIGDLTQEETEQLREFSRNRK